MLAHAEKLAGLEGAIMDCAPVPGPAKSGTALAVGHGVEAFLNAYGLNTHEGLALMCLAEALLRILDAVTADALDPRYVLEDRQWGRYVGEGDSWLVKMSSWGFKLLTGKIIDAGQEAAGMRCVLSGRPGVAPGREPVIREAPAARDRS